MKKTELVKFLENVFIKLTDNYEGCIFCRLADELYLVAANTVYYSDDESTLLPTAKIAYNCDDLQSDYDTDWFMPYYQDGCAHEVEFELVPAKFESQANLVLSEVQEILTKLAVGILLIN